MTPKQEKWYSDTLAAFATKGNSWEGAKSFTWCAASLGVTPEQAIADAHAAGVTHRDEAITRGIMSAAAKIGSRPTAGRSSLRLNTQRQAFPDYVRGIIRDGGGTARPADLADASPVNVRTMTREVQSAAFLTALYTLREQLHIFSSNLHRQAALGRDILACEELLSRLQTYGSMGGDCISKNPLTGKQGRTTDGKPSLVARACIADYRYALIEFDHLPMTEQCAFWLGWLSRPKLAGKLASLTFSGGKSIHGLIRTGANEITAPTIESDLRALLCTDPEERYRADRNTIRPHGGTRLAGAIREGKDGGKVQRLIYLAP